jgi:antitoxin HicB
MSVERNPERTARSGSTLDSFLEEEGIREEVEAVAIKRVQAWQIERALQEQKKTNKRSRKFDRASR